MKKRLISLLALTLSGMLILGGCQKAEPQPEENNQEEVSEAVEGYIPCIGSKFKSSIREERIP